MTTSTTTQPASARIRAEVESWPGVTSGTGRRGEFAFRLGKRELGHLHGDRVFHTGLPKRVWHDLHAQGRIDFHPVFPETPGYGARAITSDHDVDDVIAILRMNYDRAVAKHGLPDAVPGLRALDPVPLPFAPDVAVRAFVLTRAGGDVLVYGAPGVADARPDVTRQYLGHWHEAMFPGAIAEGVPLLVHEADRAETERHGARVRASFTRRHTHGDDLEVIPIPGHTPGSTALLWTAPDGRRVLFTADSVYLDGDEWVAAVLDSSDRAAYVESLDLLADLDVDVLAPWAASADGPYLAAVGRDEARRRLKAVRDRVWSGEDRD